MDFDLDVYSYSIDELKIIIHLDTNDDENNINENDLNFAITKSLQKLVHIQELEQEEKNQVQEFYYNIRDRLLKFSREQHKLKTDVSNYKIQNTSTLKPHYVHKNIETTEEGKRKELIEKSLNDNKNPYDYQYKGGVFPRNVNYDLNSFKNDIEIDGGLNSVKKKYLTRLINIDSSWRDNEKKSDINNFNFRISPNLKNVLSIRLMSLELPISWYTFSSKLKNNSFTIKVYNYPTEENYMNINNINNEIIEKGEFNITIDDGNYTINELIDLLNYKMNYNNDEDKYTPLKLFEWKYDINKNKIVMVIKNTYTIENVSDDTSTSTPTTISIFDKLNDTFSYELLFANKRETLERKAGWILGFRKSSYHVKKNNIYKNIASLNSIYYWSIITESFYNPTIYPYIYVCIEDYIQNKYDTLTGNIEKNNIDNIALVRISTSTSISTSSHQYHLSSPYNSSSIQYVQFNTNEHIPFCIKREYFGPITLDKLKISIRDQYGNIIPLQQDFSLAIQCEIMYS
jgi:hypothetical protein